MSYTKTRRKLTRIQRERHRGRTLRRWRGAAGVLMPPGWSAVVFKTRSVGATQGFFEDSARGMELMAKAGFGKSVKKRKGGGKGAHVARVGSRRT